MNVNVKYATEVVLQLPPLERLELLAKMAVSLKHELNLADLGNSFWVSPDPVMLAERQGFRQPDEIRPLAAFDGDVEEFNSAVRSWRDEDLAQESK